jgi:hypothetical protein
VNINTYPEDEECPYGRNIVRIHSGLGVFSKDGSHDVDDREHKQCEGIHISNHSDSLIQEIVFFLWNV